MQKRFFSWLYKMGYCKLICVFLILCICYACYIKAEGSDSYFGKEQKVCDNEDCEEEINTKESEKLKDQHDDYIGKAKSSSTDVKSSQEEINVIITFTNAKNNINLQNKFKMTVTSLLKHTSIKLAIHIIGDPDSQRLAKDILDENVLPDKKNLYRMVNLDVDTLARKLDDIVRPMQDHFSYKPGAYYNHALFFLSIAIHRVMPQDMEKVIMMDADLKYMADIHELYNRFSLFTEENVIGIARDAQPVYRHTFWKYRGEHKGTRVGEPPPNGLTGFNSGVLLLDLKKMRSSKLYNSLITKERVGKLTEEFYFKGHLGDQDFFTLLLMKYEELFHVLPCEWNRQLCTWWRDHGYKEVFGLYHDCKAKVKIFHGNCNTPIP